MSHCQLDRGRGTRRSLALLALALVISAFDSTAGTQPITNLIQLTRALNATAQLNAEVTLELIVCAASRPSVGALIVKDETGVELLQVGDFQREIRPGETIRIHRKACLLRKREAGIEISAPPVVNNDGLHPRTLKSGELTLRAGLIPLRLDWFNYWRAFGLEVQWADSNSPPNMIASARLWHAPTPESGTTNLRPGLRFECFEGGWETVPDFNQLKPAKTGVATNFDLAVRSRSEGVAIRYTGYLEVPQDGRYQFSVWSDDGTLLFLGDPRVAIVRLGQAEAPKPEPTELLAARISHLDERRWMVVEGRVSFVSQTGEGVQFDLGTDRHVISVRVADAAGLKPAELLNARVRVTGIGRGKMGGGHTPVLAQLVAANAQDLVFVEKVVEPPGPARALTSVAGVQSLSIERARQSLPVHLRGTVTGAIYSSQERWMSFQDDTRGVFVRLPDLSNSVPALGEMWELEGYSAAGDFAPIVVAEKLTRLGEGLLPMPVRPTWTDLLNGNKDVQWAELQGLVAGIHSNTISLHLPEGRLDVELDGQFESDLQPFLNAVVKIRGVLYALWDATTREVRVGRVMMRSSTISVNVPATADPFDAVVRTPRELLLFDAHASAFRPVKVRGQIVYADPTQLFLEEGGTGLRLLPVEKTDARPGDMVEAVGYPDIGRTQLLLREVLLRKTGQAPLPQPPRMDETGLSQNAPNATRIHIEGKLLGWHAEEGAPVLEMQFGDRLYLARIAQAKSDTVSLRRGSVLALQGVYVGGGYGRSPNVGNGSFELLLNSLADITVLSQPSWWTLPRLLALMGVLLVILIFTVIWNSQLRRLVEQRTAQLQHETRERERVERQRALEAERSRIARDLHDDLGSSLTEISVLASTGQRTKETDGRSPLLFNAITEKARNLIAALDVIVWAVDPEANSLQSLADYLSSYADEYLAHSNIACRFKIPASLPSVTLDGRIRHDLFLAVKETLHNVVRHSQATEVEFQLTVGEGAVDISISDNGAGFKVEGIKDGHGLRNIASRLNKIGGNCQMQSLAGAGTKVNISLPLPASHESPSIPAA